MHVKAEKEKQEKEQALKSASLTSTQTAIQGIEKNSMEALRLQSRDFDMNKTNELIKHGNEQAKQYYDEAVRLQKNELEIIKNEKKLVIQPVTI